jgi:hypothetical protein
VQRLIRLLAKLFDKSDNKDKPDISSAKDMSEVIKRIDEFISGPERKFNFVNEHLEKARKKNGEILAKMARNTIE